MTRPMTTGIVGGAPTTIARMIAAATTKRTVIPGEDVEEAVAK